VEAMRCPRRNCSLALEVEV